VTAPTPISAAECLGGNDMSNELIRPIDPDSAHAIEEAAKATSKAIDAAVKAGGYGGAVLGELPHDLLGIMGDWVKHVRARRWADLQSETDRILGNRGVENRERVSPSVAIPLIAGAINEDREVLKQMWAKLLAAAMDPARANRVRASIIETLKKMDNVDALVLSSILPLMSAPNWRDALKTRLKISGDEITFPLTTS
jgi:hypothetical protein